MRNAMNPDDINQLAKDMNAMYDSIQFDGETKAARNRRIEWRRWLKGVHQRYLANKRVVSNFLLKTPNA